MRNTGSRTESAGRSASVPPEVRARPALALLAAVLLAAGATPADAQGGASAVALSADTPVAVTGGLVQGAEAAVDDLYFAGPVRAHARHQAAVAPVWMYHFTRVPPTPWGEALGAHHAAELVYVFGTLTTSDEPGERPLGLSPLGDFTEVDTGLSEAMRAYWIQFAAAGDPNGAGLPAWPAWEPASDPYLELGVEVSAGDGLHVEGAALWDRFQAQRRGER